jgi:ketosteroid isomerase-like protein
VTDSANVALVRSIYADWERGDFRRTDWADPDIEFAILGGPDPGTWAGISAMSDAWRAWLSAWDYWDAVAVEYRELDSGRVLVLTTGRGRGKSSGLGVGQLYAHSGKDPSGDVDKAFGLFQVRDDKVTRLVIYWDLDRALADLGLEE